MKAIILCAGQGRRLLPHTESTPKCLLPLGNKYFIEWQIDTLMAVGIKQVTAVVGYAAQRVTELLNERYGVAVQTVYNPFFEIADNLASCWMVRHHINDEFILLNGDTLFEPAIITQLLQSSDKPVVITTDHKDTYDEDDMKIIADQSDLLAVGKKLPLEQVNGESIGILRFDRQGAKLFKDEINQRMYQPQALQQWYLSAIDKLAQQGHVGTCSIHGKDWTELDFVHDLEQAQELVEKWQQQPIAVRL